MTDVHSKKIRSYNMSQIKCKDTKPELIVRRFLHLKGFRYRLHVTQLPGKPDIVLPKYRTIIFIHGCFWHKHENCRYFVIPKTRTDWWLTKIKGNVEKDIGNYAVLKEMDWNIIVIWECELKPKQCEETLKNLLTLLKI